jgi:hypothetical protein
MSWITGMLAEPDRRVLVDPLVFKAVRGGMTEALRRGPAMVIADADIYLAEWGFSPDQISYPVTFWHGKEDRNIGWEYSAKLVSQMPNAAGHWIEGEGHYSLPVFQGEAILSEALKR